MGGAILMIDGTVGGLKRFAGSNGSCGFGEKG